ncbi:hypothetical protein DFQ28_004869 [Apophysomyces sp. BC1034]|nr:hypothetical protein DFQ30_004798 [Apophysomyces sp. BC1015]KAG0178189.1 hypothetical protein DFQ29_003813 [Apophysomyces sp. BC1021]KAG0188435.1 hypothetical protein DFQ28_004869 [Apophysomyces sp. BC1034]
MSRIQPLSPESPEFKGISSLNIIYEAGLDRESRPVLVLCASNLPNPDIFDYDLILRFILARLDEFVENDYVLIFFSSPAKFRPPWLWLLKAYRALDRKYKKNLKALYVLHLTRSYRIIFDLANKITSPKFARKLHYMSSLRELANVVPLPSHFIPQPVIHYDTEQKTQPKQTPGYTQPRQSTQSLALSLAFGRSLEDLAKLEGWADSGVHVNEPVFIPKVVLKVTQHLRGCALDKEGLFRKSPSSEELRKVKEAFNRGEDVDLSCHDSNVSAALLKVFLRELPDPIISIQFSSELGTIPESDYPPEIIDRVKQKLKIAYNHRPHHLGLLKFLTDFLHEVSQHSEKNRMTAHNLGVVFTPNVIRAIETDMGGSVKPQVAAASAALYLIQMNQGMGLMKLLITERQILKDI